MKKNQNKNIAIFAFSLLALIGTYNAVMINSDSQIASGKSFKRLDEVLGVVKEGRSLAVATDWRKISKKEVKPAAVAAVKVEASSPASVNEVTVEEAAINETLDLKLVEVINPKKWEKGVNASEFNGSIATNNGIIETLRASLPEGMMIDISFSELTGNAFEYDLNGEIYSGMMYQVDQNAYMITMTNGPLEGTRLRFAGESVDAQTQKEMTENYLAENHNVEIGNFGAEIEAPVTENVQPEVSEVATAETASFNF